MMYNSKRNICYVMVVIAGCQKSSPYFHRSNMVGYVSLVPDTSSSFPSLDYIYFSAGSPYETPLQGAWS